MTSLAKRGATDDTRRKWAMMLAPLVCPSFAADTAASLVAMLPFLAGFPDGAFCPGSAEAVAMAPRKQAAPDLNEVRAALQAWMRDNMPPPKAIAAPGDDWRVKHAAVEAGCKRSWSDPASVREAARAVDDNLPMAPMLQGLLACLIAKWAPENLGLLPPAWLARYEQKRTEEAARR